MVARDDSVIRGSLIASLIFLVLSLALNYFFWSWGNTQSIESARKQTQLDLANDGVRKLTSQSELMRAMLGAEEISEASFEALRGSAGGDPKMEDIERRYLQDMSYFPPETPVSGRNYPNLPEFLVKTVRDLNDRYERAVEEAATVRKQAESDIANARTAQQQAEKVRDETLAKLEGETAKFAEDREKQRKVGEEMKSDLIRTVGDFQKFQKVATDTKNKLTSDATALKNTVENQRQELNTLRRDKFENVQGEIQYVVPPGELVLINLGSSDALRAGVQFGVIAAESINLQDAPVKAQIEVVKVLNANTAQARVIGLPSYRDPLIAGDKIYSPFWAPGRKVRIALAGEIDIDGDNRSDVTQLRAMIELAGAEVAAVISKTGGVEGQLDAGVRFLVVGEQPDLGSGLDTAASEADAQFIAQLGRIKAEAVEKGITVIPAWKLQAYLKTINDSVTTPLGSAVQGSDFPPETTRTTAGRDVGSVLPELYRNQQAGQ